MKVLSVPQNLVLVKVDEEFKEWGIKGLDGDNLVIPVGPASKSDPYENQREKELRQTQADWDKAQHVAITGEVIMLPDRMIYNGDLIGKIVGHYGVSMELAAEISELRVNSAPYKVPMELEVGDKIYFKYIEQYNCIKENRFVEDGGIMYSLMNYGSITMAIRNGETIMVNGNILIEPIVDQTAADKLASAFSKIGANGLLTPLKREKKSRNIQFGILKYAGAVCEAYLDNHNEEDDPNIKIGDIVAFDPRFAISLEHDYHREFDNSRLVRMQRKEVLMIMGKDLDLDKFKF